MQKDVRRIKGNNNREDADVISTPEAEEDKLPGVLPS